MSWFWNSSSSTDGKGDDPKKKLDASLRDFLETEQSKDYKPSKSAAPRTTYLDKAIPQATAAQSETEKAVPRESLFQDGRYAHLWKTYQPQGAIETEAESVDPARQMLDEVKARKSALKDAALENCAEEQETLQMCFELGSLSHRMWARASMCHKENTEFSRCYEMQSKFLQALNYTTAYRRTTVEQLEVIQMHADKLYHRMIDHEKAVEVAKAEGKTPPKLSSLFQQSSSATSNDSYTKEGYSMEDVPAWIKKINLSTPLEKMTPLERELEVRTIIAQQSQATQDQVDVEDIFRTEEQGRSQRREKMSSWFGEGVANFIIPPPDNLKKQQEKAKEKEQGEQ